MDVALVLSGLNPAGSFTFVNAPRSIAPGKYQDVVVQFRPLSNKRFVETPTVSVSSRGAALEVLLTGEGVSPTLTLDPEDGVLDMGHVVAGDSTSRTVQLRNTSMFPLAFTLQRRGRAYTNYNGLPVFDAVPSEGTIAAGAELTVTVSFAPDHTSRTEFSTALRVMVPNQTRENVILAKGRSWARQVYALPASRLDDMEESAPAMAEAQVDAPLAVLTARDESAGDAAEQPYQLRLEFPKPKAASDNDDGAADGTGADADADAPPTAFTKTVVVGCASRPDGKPSSAGAYEVTLPADDPAVQAGWFTVDNGKGAPAAGSHQEVTFTFHPPSVLDGSNTGALDVGQWSEVHATIALSGGATLDGVPASQVVPVLLRGYVYM